MSDDLVSIFYLTEYSWEEEMIDLLGFNDTSTLMGHFVSSPRDRRNRRGDEREGQRRTRNRNGSEETDEIKMFLLYPYLVQG